MKTIWNFTRDRVHLLWLYMLALFVHAEQLKPVRVKKKPQQYEEVMFQYGTIKHLLEDLDVSFKHMKKMTPKRTSMQAIIKKYGPFIMGGRWYEDEGLSPNRLDGFGVYGLPTFMIGYWPLAQRARAGKEDIDQHIKDNVECYFCAVKTNHFSCVKKRKGYVYYEVVYVYFYDKKPAEIFFYVQVNKKTGNVTALAMPTTKITVIPNKKHPSQPSRFPRKKWHMPDLIQDEEKHSKNQIKEHLEERFCLFYNAIMTREYGVNIIVKKGRQRATFTVPQDRWKYFFKERIKAKTPSGHTKPIYHSVTAHLRQTKTKLTSVTTHYRGLRHFLWNGYEIRIVMQGKHARSQADLGVETETEPEADKKYLDVAGATADRINRVFEG